MKSRLSMFISLAVISLTTTNTNNATRSQGQEAWNEPRFFSSGTPIFSNGYCDQPYVVVLPDGSWMCAFTTGTGREGAGGQHIAATRSHDKGTTWSEPVKIEPETGPSASWAMPYLTTFGRVYVFYDYNGDRIEHLPGKEDAKKIREDMLGWYCYKYSDDSGQTWSDRYRLPVRTTACDRANQWGGKVQVLWGIGKPQSLSAGGMIFGFTKLGRYMLDNGEGWFFRCDNINSERDPRRLAWQNLPDGDHGVRHPDFGSVQEEHNLVELSDGTLYCVYRTSLGFPVVSISKDKGRTWNLPEKLCYATGEAIPNPRACPRLFKCTNGRFLFWFENNHATSYDHRNPAWLSGGVEKRDGTISWSQPEILIYSDDTSRHTGRFSYPDLIELNGNYWVTTTNKVEARIFAIDPQLLEGLWAQVDNTLASTKKRLPPDAHWDTKQLKRFEISLADWNRGQATPGSWIDPQRRDKSLTLQFTVKLDSLAPNQILFDARTIRGDGMVVGTTQDERIQVKLRSGEEASWCTDKGFIKAGKEHHVSVILNNGPGIIMGLVDHRFCDGNREDWFGWHRYRDLDAVKNHRIRENRPSPRSIRAIPLNKSLTAKVDGDHVIDFSIHNRALTVSEALNR